LNDFFPGCDILAAAEGRNDGERFHRMRLRHHALVLRVDVNKDGRLLDIDTVK
jgi:phage/plasmid-associated DNA primase